MIKAVFFDLDGTLLDRDTSLLSFLNTQYERLGQWLGHIPKDRYIARFIELDKRGYVWKDKVYDQLIVEFEICGIGQEALLQDYLMEFKHHCVPFSGLLATLNELKKRSIRMGIVTNGKGQFQMDNIKALDIEPYFDAILVSEWEGMRKPDARLFLRALECLQAAPEESVFIGDHPENDVRAARHVGMKGIWKRDRQWDEAEADGVIDNLMEILEWIAAKEKPLPFTRN
ncbi:putative hydrolase of the HAD superfamily [Planomicrobium soli]|uniref:Putative hydrolase of the HAD superfamily n=1 Tax=Planomicrobium soli TaxID=1176648 RepID=A0A2P8H215_9BACL|nr:HAD family hydrolase [Planomicrobium soli]PSL40254.1 putative hydrolase of the HAD superfamily [Planomicrobium soli]